jgi:transmembrane sensor
MSREVDLPIMEEAADWFARLEGEEASEATRAEFSAWLLRSPVHIQEFLSISAMHHAMTAALSSDPEWLSDLLEEASSEHANVIDITDFATDDVPQPGKRRSPIRFTWQVAAAAVVIMTLAVVAILNLTPVGLADRFTTTIGEQRWVALDDGSTVHLNTDSEIRVRMTNKTRRITLLRGEAVFDVEHDPARPFQVLVDTVLVEAVGTRFNIHRKDEQVVVTVLEGKVVVRPESSQAMATRVLVIESKDEPARAPGPAPSPETSQPQADAAIAPSQLLRLDTGQQTTVNADGSIVTPAIADISRVTAWTKRRIVFDSDSLESVVEEFNRYNRSHLEIVDPTLKDRRITGAFNIDDPDAFLVLLASLVDIRTELQPDGTRLIHQASSDLD